MSHPSSVRNRVQSYERLEFLGDRILDVLLCLHLFRVFPKDAEGPLTVTRSHLATSANWSRIADEMGLREFIGFGPAFRHNTVAEDRILGDVLEASVAAIFLDGGWDAAQAFFDQHIKDRVVRPPRDPKSELQDICQKNFRCQPDYRIVAQSGPEHQKEYVCGVFVNDEQIATGKGGNKRDAERSAAEASVPVLRERLQQRKEERGAA